MLYSTYIYKERDRVHARALRVGGLTLESANALHFCAGVVKLARLWRSKLELLDRASDDYDAALQTFILTDKGDWVPVDHVLWRTTAGEEVRVDFTRSRTYVHDRKRPRQDFRRPARAWRMFASAVRRLVLTK